MHGHPTVVADLASREIDFAEQSFREVYHLAGLAHLVPVSQSEQERFFLYNVEGTRNLLCALERARSLPQAFVLISTVAVYGREDGILVDEETPRKATDPYGASKREAEDLVVEWGGRRGVRITLLRLPLVAGARAPGNLGALVRALACGRYLGVGRGDARRSMVLASDVAQVLPRAAEVGGTFHLTDGYHPSFHELETALATALGRRHPARLPVPLAVLLAHVGDALQMSTGRKMPLSRRALTKMRSTLTFSDDRARRELGWAPSRVLEHVGDLIG
jgi:nucleoside-diphosphate-sugar epimerase